MMNMLHNRFFFDNFYSLFYLFKLITNKFLMQFCTYLSAVQGELDFSKKAAYFNLLF